MTSKLVQNKMCYAALDSLFWKQITLNVWLLLLFWKMGILIKKNVWLFHPQILGWPFIAWTTPRTFPDVSSKMDGTLLLVTLVKFSVHNNNPGKLYQKVRVDSLTKAGRFFPWAERMFARSDSQPRYLEDPTGPNQSARAKHHSVHSWAALLVYKDSTSKQK